ncbi:hypothetical protein ABMA27_008641 [Loxostege sticticalis]|uniref:Uncharacterized protein n=1 Tax=Loxostege sticticalis TaxID=481309 RepID=A0ABR3HC38_LOXSC
MEDVRLRAYFWEENQWRIQLAIPALSEKRAVVNFIIKAFGIPYYNHTLTKSPPTLFFVNNNMAQHVWESEKTYGKWLWLIQLLIGKKSAFCVYLQFNILPIKN